MSVKDALKKAYNVYTEIPGIKQLREFKMGNMNPAEIYATLMTGGEIRIDPETGKIFGEHSNEGRVMTRTERNQLKENLSKLGPSELKMLREQKPREFAKGGMYKGKEINTMVRRGGNIKRKPREFAAGGAYKGKKHMYAAGGRVMDTRRKK